MTTEEGARIIEQEERIEELEKELKNSSHMGKPPIIRAKCSMPLGDFKEWAIWMKEINKGIDIVVIPNETEVVKGE